MAVSQSFLAFVLEQLAGVPDLSSRRMFGGVGLYSLTTFFAVIDNDTLFFKVNDETRPRYVTRGMPPFQPMPDMGPMMGYYQVPAGILEDAEAMTEWSAEAIEVGRESPPRRRPTRASARPADRSGARAGRARSPRGGRRRS